MNRNITVFILLILIASSFKYRTKTSEQVLPLSPVPNRPVTNVSLQSGAFEKAVLKLQEGSREFAEGQPSIYKSLWSHSDDVSNFCGLDGKEFKGWQSVEKSLDSFNQRISGNNAFRYEKIAGQASHEQGYVLQKEHYTLHDGSKLDLNVTIVFRLENNEWKIVHRQSDELSVPAGAIIAAK
ncbi:nuclear transport factor 2 family protein [Dyadobacter sp. CY347]|uniref:nuclear transport factor 2 family protein n=1 Tax=Dyadobacter sp. CY347 TaxID=2909336 RepID=UPI001F46E8EC|nr:nuclear transport factor 2 family protein [Dyadobacter sp. CY347]MCF2486958.1 nuclear transport factor 2 family protein [Dyadobacter sp. CY347]